MAYYYWNPTAQQPIYQFPQTQFPQTQFPQTPQTPVPGRESGTTPPTSVPGGGFMPPTGGAAFREESYIENILRLNRGKIGTFYFTVPESSGVNGQGNTKVVRGYVEAAGRDHAIISEASTGHRFLFPMIYFDFAEFDEELAYFNQTPGIPTRRS